MTMYADPTTCPQRPWAPRSDVKSRNVVAQRMAPTATATQMRSMGPKTGTLDATIQVIPCTTIPRAATPIPAPNQRQATRSLRGNEADRITNKAAPVLNPTVAATASRADAASLSRKGLATMANTRRPRTVRSRQPLISEARAERLSDPYQDISYHYR